MSEHDTWPQHVWVDVTGRFSSQQTPGLLIAWRRGQRGWEGWVISADRHPTGSGGEVTVRQGWHLAAHIRPVDSA